MVEDPDRLDTIHASDDDGHIRCQVCGGTLDNNHRTVCAACMEALAGTLYMDPILLEKLKQKGGEE